MPQGAQFTESIHGHALRCQDCHGGDSDYRVETADKTRFAAYFSTTKPAAPLNEKFDHGERFRGKPARKDVPTSCGECHSDVARMNPYGLRTDQLSSYWVSGHGKRLKETGDEHVAVCIDCHGAHDIYKHDSPKSRIYFQNVPTTCGRCHADASLMTQYKRPTNIIEQYENSIHGQNVLKKSDAGSPNCATCHGSHAAAPPGVADVGHVCGKCHQQVETEFSSGVHGKLPLFPRCVGCHAREGGKHNHAIHKASPSTNQLVDVFREIREDYEGDAARAEFTKRVDALPNTLLFSQVCRACHDIARADPHAQFVRENSPVALEKGVELAGALRLAQFEYARTAERIERLSRGVLLVKDEAVRLEEIRTELLSLNVAMHTLDATGIHDRVRKLKEICAEVNGSLDGKELGLNRRYQVTWGVWGFIVVFVSLMYRKYKLLRAEYVISTPRPASTSLPVVTPAPVPVVGRRKFFERSLRTLGAVGTLALIWPVIAYVFPSRKRGGAGERVSAGKTEGWAVWEMKKVSVAGKAVGVIRTDNGFKAFSLICTHLGCIVQWSSTHRSFECPCHEAKFDAEGRVTGGPPPKPLPSYNVAVAQGDVIVTAPS
ncbi:MAG: Rieske 2Fe-2S domain-containing protein [Planctomycetes bacterium]|nr:Rieske 2Fe-2S domain-containing protein [Planctomycetota bacterium]